VQQDPNCDIEAAIQFDRPHAFASQYHSQESSAADLYSSYWIHLEAVLLDLLDDCPADVRIFETPLVQRLWKLCGQDLILFQYTDACKKDCADDLNALLSALSEAQHYQQLHVLLHSMWVMVALIQVQYPAAQVWLFSILISCHALLSF
jgi:hypothetical protein